MDVEKIAAQTAVVVKAHVERAVAPLLAKIAELEQREPERGEKGDSGDKGDPGQDGTSVSLVDLEAYVDELLDAKTARWELDFEKRAQSRLDRIVEAMPKPRDGVDGKDGAKGLDGRDALSVDDFTMTLGEDGRTVTVGLKAGDVEVTKSVTFAIPQDRGFYKDGNEYEKGDGVTCGGSYWYAQKATSSKPEVGNEDWRLAVKKGRDGKDGDQGKPGEKGMKGDPGLNGRDFR